MNVVSPDRRADHENQSPASRALPGIALRRIAVVLLLAFGYLFWWNHGRAIDAHAHELMAAVVILALCAVPQSARTLFWGIEWFRRCTAAHPNLVSVLIGLLSLLFLWNSCAMQHIEPFLKWNDEFSYFIQTQMFAHGRLWMPAHPLWRSFDALYLIQQPVYASMYFPGTALTLLPQVWLGLPKMFTTLVICAAAAGLLFRVGAELLDGPFALLAVMMLLAVRMYRFASTLILSQNPMLLFGLIMLLAYLRWRATGFRFRWIVLLGIFAGWAAVTRPADALAYAIAIGAAMAWDLRKSNSRVWLQTGALLIVCAAPFLSLQLVLDRRITGHWMTTPYTYCLTRIFPGTEFGFHSDAADSRPATDTPQILVAYQNENVQQVRDHRVNQVWHNFVVRRLPGIWNECFGSPFFWVLIPIGTIGIFRSRVWLVCAALPIAFIIYAAFQSFPPHYLIPYLPGILLLLAAGAKFISDVGGKRRFQIEPAVLLIVGALCVLAFPQFNRQVLDEGSPWTEMSQINDTLDKIHEPSIVLFHFNYKTIYQGASFTNSSDVEPVYNYTAAWPDDAFIIRANDLNHDVSADDTPADRNRELYAYYTTIAPKRHVYIYDRLPVPSVRDLGEVGKLTEKLSAETPDHR